MLRISVLYVRENSEGKLEITQVKCRKIPSFCLKHNCFTFFMRLLFALLLNFMCVVTK